MSKYNKFARKLNESFEDAREKYSKAYNEFVKTQKEYNNAIEYIPGESNYDCEKRRTVAKLKLIEAKEAFELVRKESWDTFKSSVKEIEREFKEAVRSNSVADPDLLDLKMVELLKSGMLNVNDMEHLSEKYSDNYTMTKLIGRYAGDMAKMVEDAGERERLNTIYNDGLTGTSRKQEEFKKLVSDAMIFAGQTREDNTDEHIYNMANKWNGCMSSVIENF